MAYTMRSYSTHSPVRYACVVCLLMMVALRLEKTSAAFSFVSCTTQPKQVQEPSVRVLRTTAPWSTNSEMDRQVEGKRGVVVASNSSAPPMSSTTTTATKMIASTSLCGRLQRLGVTTSLAVLIMSSASTMTLAVDDNVVVAVVGGGGGDCQSVCMYTCTSNHVKSFWRRQAGLQKCRQHCGETSLLLPSSSFQCSNPPVTQTREPKLVNAKRIVTLNPTWMDDLLP
jgi:hypothetical protein